ncbi:uncharacterized protein LOC122628567 [Vespula pensylvanica]|uniref:uncharacterized protein LOC122628567 n=1 Tax=Vespula pensylvanica TaxID=30213 RepID=UPI001CBA256E|nr:uncharacterized protein LOC122628567 [Vespula pensylvanica]
MDTDKSNSRKQMLHPGRRSAISISELGLYFDRSDRYRRNRYNSIVRKFVIGIMVLITVILVAVFLYDFTSATSSNKINQETKHIYVLQNALRKAPSVSKKIIDSKTSSETTIQPIEDRSYDDKMEEKLIRQNETSDQITDEASVEQLIEAESRSQNPSNFKLRKRLLKSIDDCNDEEDDPENKQLFDNHAMFYRVKQRYKHQESEEEDNLGDRRPAPFHWEYRTPHPSSFKRTKFPQLTQYRYPHASRNIQDIIKYLTNDAEMPSRGIKFTGVYVNPKKYDVYPEMADSNLNADRSEEIDDTYYPMNYNGDPFYQYKPKHPSDVNLLATSNVRFSPAGINRYNPYYDPYFLRPTFNKPSPTEESQLQNSYISNSYQKRKKPQPFSVMLDIYPITDIVEQNKKNAKPKPQIPLEDYETRRPIQFNRNPKFYSSNPQPIVAVPNQQVLTDEEERQQMIFHLNLYPRRKNKLSRHELIHRSEIIEPEEREHIIEKIMTPLESIAKHITDHSSIENSKQDENEEEDEVTALPVTRLQEKVLMIKDEKNANETIDQTELYGGSIIIPSNHKSSLEEDYASTEKYEYEVQKSIVTTTTTMTTMTTTTTDGDNRENTTMLEDNSTTEKNKIIDLSTDIDTLEGFERFDRGFTRTN